MAEDTRSEDRTDFQGEAGGDTGFTAPTSGTASSSQEKEPSGRFKAYGSKGLKPFEELLEKHGDELLPYFDSLVTGLQEGGRHLSQSESADGESKAGDQVSHWMSETAGWISQVRDLLKGRDYKRVIEFIENEGVQRPSLMFSSSYVLGLFLGRLGRYVERSRTESSDKGSEDKSVGGREFASTDDIPPISERH